MARPLRIEFEDAIYHLSARDNARQPVFRDEPDCARFLKLLSESAEHLRAFRWSSYRGYAGLSAPFPFVQETIVLDELRGPRRAERLRYRRFAEKGLLREVENPFEAVQ